MAFENYQNVVKTINLEAKKSLKCTLIHLNFKIKERFKKAFTTFNLSNNTM